MERKKYPIKAEDYRLHEEIGHGVSAKVFRAICIPLNEIIAIKVLDFEKTNSNLDNIRREAQTMILVDHPNVLKAHCSFVHEHTLWVVMPYMAGGSCLHILKHAYPDGFEETIIATVLREALKGIAYLHHHGHIHRDIKAGNILVEATGAIKLGDFGVSVCLYDSGDRQRSRNTFVGTPCWMAPEVMEQLHGYNFKADIWSFGITALELAHGHAPFSKYPPMKVLLMTLQNAPPGLDYERDKKFSKSFKQMIAMCLAKDPSKRPSAEKLLKHAFFKQARSNDYMARTILDGMPSLGDRIRHLKDKEADMLAQKKMPDGEKEERSQNEYNRGISAWNFNIEDVKAQASLIPDVDDILPDKDQGMLGFYDSLEKDSNCQPAVMDISDMVATDGGHATGPGDAHLPLPGQDPKIIRFKAHGFEDDFDALSLTGEGSARQSTSVMELQCNNADIEKFANEQEVVSNPFLPLATYKGERFKYLNIIILSETFILIVIMRNRKVIEAYASSAYLTNSDDLDEKSKGPVVQQKGRFKVTSENVDLEKVPHSPVLQKSHSLQVITQLPSNCLPSPSDSTIYLPSSMLYPQIQSVLYSNVVQRDYLLQMLKTVSTGDAYTASRLFCTANCVNDLGSTSFSNIASEKSLLEAANEREKELLAEVSDLQWRLICASEELQRYKARDAQV
ncbi:STE20/SPS1-related proline-alanine-rich protein kinase [Amborella trichopoda]|uniref:STE20/SPS1-related proline-alanine-rich protein kinase n=1 Tax=Amborella trichopoda TaxID=13333 RepID=UPI0009BEB77C|nr:STE20/SPS1-related proline-alanine-rich protein kinase [Amborella trichopoda]|eukprot:XP_020523620.1 STE20/SPS1-related proline-alanine-rich protein kinase [Amborella trichopoda]